MHNINPPLLNVTEANNHQPFGGVDPMALIVFLVTEASTITAQTASIHAKQMKQNAQAQQILNDEDANMKWFSVPKLKDNQHHKTIWHNHGTTFNPDYTEIFQIWVTHPNEGAVNNAMAKNQKISSDRQYIAQQLSVLQQDAQISETNINSLTDASMQSTQEGSSLIQILQTLTFKALLRQEPQV